MSDLLRWQDASPPVVVVVWDVDARTGIWIDVPAAVVRLGEANEKWREQKTVTVHFPLENRLDQEDGQRKLRRRLADLAIPAIGKGKTLTFTPTFTFPKDEEGKALRAQFAGRPYSPEDGVHHGKKLRGFPFGNARGH